MKSFFENNGGTYRLEGDCLLPNLVLQDDENCRTGKYGRMRFRFLKEHRPGLYAELLCSGKLDGVLAETEEICSDHMDRLCSIIAKQEGVDEALKAENQFEWLRRQYSIRERAEEIVLKEFIYTL